MTRLLWLLLLPTFAASLASAQSAPQVSFDGVPLNVWVSRILEDTSAFRRDRVAAAVRRAPQTFRRAFVTGLAPALESTNGEVKSRALNAIGRLVNEGQFGSIVEERGPDLAAAVPALRRIADDPRDSNRRVAWFLLSRTDSATRRMLAPAARAALNDPDPGIRWQAVQHLRFVRDSVDVPRILNATRDSSASVRETSLLALSNWQPRRALTAFVAALNDTVHSVREAAITGLGRVGPAASASAPRLLPFLGDGAQEGSNRASAAWALAQIFPRHDEQTFIQVKISDASMGIRSDGLGPYVHGADSIEVTQAASLNLDLGGLRGDGRAVTLRTMRPLRRSMIIDLSRPVRESGATARGVVRDNEAIVHMAFTHVHERTMVSVTRLEPNDTLTAVERVEFQFRINGIAHLLQMGEWTQGEFNRNAPRVSGAGTSTARVAHPNAATWTVVAPEGSRARLWDLSDPQHPVDKGLFVVPFEFRWSSVNEP